MTEWNISDEWDEEDIEVGVCGCIPLSEEQAVSWSLYPDWANRKTLFDTPALLFTIRNNEIKVRMPVGDYSLAPIEAYLPKSDAEEIQYQANGFMDAYHKGMEYE